MCRRLGSSVRVRLYHVTVSGRHAFRSLLCLERRASSRINSRRLRRTIGRTRPFFTSLSDLPVCGGNNGRTMLGHCLLFLRGSTGRNVRNGRSLLTFVGRRRLCFGSFLRCLPSFTSSSVNSVEQGARRYYQRVLHTTSHGSLSRGSTVVCLSVHAGRHLLHGTRTTVRSLGDNEMGSRRAVRTCLLVVVRPFVAVSSLSIDILSSGSGTSLCGVTSTLPGRVSNLTGGLRLSGRHLSSVPVLVVGVCIAELWAPRARGAVVLRRFYSSFLTIIPLRLPRLLSGHGVRGPIGCSSCILLAFRLGAPFAVRRIVSVLRSRVRVVVLCRRVPDHRARFKRDYYTCSGPSFKQVFGIGNSASRHNVIDRVGIAVCSSLRRVSTSMYLSLDLRYGGKFFGCVGPGRRILLSFV